VATRRKAPSRTRRNLRYSTIDGTLYMVMLGLAETFFAAFVLELKLGEVASGLVLTIPLWFASVMQLATPTLVRLAGSYRTVVSISAAFQAASLLPLAYVAISGAAPAWLVFLLATLYAAGAIVGGPAWSSWLGFLVPERIRTRFFASRSRWLQIGNLAGLIFGGITLRATNILDERAVEGDAFAIRLHERLGAADLTLHGFALMFLVAFACRTVSAIILTRQSEPRPLPFQDRAVGVREFLRRLWFHPQGRVMGYMLAFQFSLQFALPYWHSYALREVGVTYRGYIALIGALLVGRMAALQWLGPASKRYGSVAVLRVAGLAAVPTSLLWILAGTLPSLILAHLCIGAILAAYELNSFLLLLETVVPEERTSMLSKFNVCQYGAMALGSAAGGWLFATTGSGAAAYVMVFAAAALVKTCSVPLLLRVGRKPPR
jgi:MFS family permease